MINIINKKTSAILFEIALLLAFFASLFLLTSLLTYSPDDSGYNAIANGLIKNYFGYAGSFLSSWLIYYFGCFAYTLPLLLMYFSYSFFTALFNNDLRVLAFLMKLFGLLVLAWSFCAFATIFLQTPLQYNGGVLGYESSKIMLKLFNLEGTFFVLLYLTINSFMFLFNFRLFDLFEFIGKHTIAVTTFINSKLINIFSSLYLFLQSKVSKVSFYQVKDQASIISEESVELDLEPSKQEKNYSNLVDCQAVTTIESASAVNDLQASFDLESDKESSVALVAEDQAVVEENDAALLEAKLAEFGVIAKVVAVNQGPLVQLFELELALGVKISKINNLSRDLARALSAHFIRIIDLVPGKNTIGIEVPRKNSEIIFFKELVDIDLLKSQKKKLSFLLGVDSLGKPFISSLEDIAHLLIAGTTGSGKSSGINTILLSLIATNPPEDLKLILIDPKLLELSAYSGIPHLCFDVINNAEDAELALSWCVAEIERRYKIMSELNVKNVKQYNYKIKLAATKNSYILDPSGLSKIKPKVLKIIPSIVVVIDEFADIILAANKSLESKIVKLAQTARAAGIHLILSTQRPSADVVTGLIKANITNRIAFKVTSKAESRTILDRSGAEELLGKGDMLFLKSGSLDPVRVHGALVGEQELTKIISYWKQFKVDYINLDVYRKQISVTEL